jgi:hypothetical protein
LQMWKKPRNDFYSHKNKYEKIQAVFSTFRWKE